MPPGKNFMKLGGQSQERALNQMPAQDGYFLFRGVLLAMLDHGVPFVSLVLLYGGTLPFQLGQNTETFAIAELGETQAKKLIPAGKRNEFAAALVPLDAFLEFVAGKEFHQLREDRFSYIHMPSPLKELKEYGICGILNSNRKMRFSQDSEMVSQG
jgi:hypothetical protein